MKKQPVNQSKKGSVRPSESSFTAKYKHLIALGIILIVTAIVYWPSLKNDFTNWDDNVYVTENDAIKNFNMQTVKHFFDTDHPVSLNYHPLTMISLAYDYHRAAKSVQPTKDQPFPGLTASYYHQTNLILHLLNTLLVFFFIWLISSRRWPVAAFVAVIFAVHPLHVESVAWISERKDVLYAFFYLAGLIAYWKYLERMQWFWLVTAFLAFLASLFSKGVAVSFPVVLILLDLYKDRKWTLRLILEKLPFLALSIYFGLLAISIQSKGALAQEGALSLIQRIVFASYGMMMYIFKLFIPIKLSTFYPYPSLNASGSIPGFFYLFPILALSFFGMIVYFWNKQKKLVFGAGFFLITIALVLQFLPVGRAIMADRYSYLPYIGLSFILAWYVSEYWKKSAALRWIAGGLGTGWVIFLLIQTTHQIKVWKNTETLWNQAIENYQDAFVAYKNRGNFYGQNGQTDLAMKDYLYLQSRGEMDSQVYGNMGNIYRMKNEMDKAFEAYSKQVELDPSDYKGHINVGIMHSIRNEHELALQKYNDALKMGAPASAVIMNRGICYNALQKYQDAITDFDAFISYNAYNPDAYRNRGLSFFQLQNYPKAIADFEKGRSLSPQDGSWAYNIAICHYKSGDLAKAAEFAAQAEKTGYQVPESFKQLLR